MRKYVNIELDKPRHLRIDFNALCEFESMEGKSLEEAMKNPGLKQIRSIVYVGLVWEDKQLRITDVGDIIQDLMREKGEDSLDYLVEKITESYEASFGKAEGKQQLTEITK